MDEKIDSFSWCQEEWADPTVSDEARELLQSCADMPPPESLCNLQEVIDNSNKFPLPFPIDTVRLKTLKKKIPVETLKRNVESTYPLIHNRVPVLMANFLIYKRKYGSSIEKQLYKDMGIPEFIDRLLLKRAATFMKAVDEFLLVSGEKGKDGWESVGSDAESPPLVLANCLSYDEMKVSALFAVSGYTACVNDGARRNVGVPKEDGVEREAVIIGVVGARFKRVHRMEYEDMVISREQNVERRGYGRDTTRGDCAARAWRDMWCRFYQIPNYTFSEASSAEECGVVQIKGCLFHNAAFARRCRLLADLTLLEANVRAAAARPPKAAFLNVVGAGLGVWRVSPHQNDVFVMAVLHAARQLLAAGAIPYVADINLAYITTGRQLAALFKPDSDSKGDKEAPRKLFLKNSSHPRGGINVQLQSREPSSALSGEHAGKLLVLTYAWDGNALPGNEFWIGKLSSSGDSAAACASQVAELHNPLINPHVRAAAAAVASPRGVTTLRDYCREHYAPR